MHQLGFLTTALAASLAAVVLTAPTAQFIDIDISEINLDSLLTPPPPLNGGIEDDILIPENNASIWPTVNLGYASYRPTMYNAEAEYLVYKNIRYARPPTGTYRFAPPAPPESTPGVQNGSYGFSCYQAIPQWLNTTMKSLDPEIDIEKFLGMDTDGEDCLFLDVSAPLDYEEDEKLPVLVWIYGGGFTYGKKDTEAYRPAGLYRRGNGDRFIFVALNYRLGAYGWLSGDTFKTQGGQPNLGLYDQRFALQWIQTHISKFGGDPQQGADATPFKRAIPQSPAWVPVPGTARGVEQQDGGYDAFINQELVNCSLVTNPLTCARGKSESAIRDANRALVNLAPYGTFTYGPVVDGAAIPDLPSNLYALERQNKTVEVMGSIVKGEGVLFVPMKLDPPLGQGPDWDNYQLFNYIKSAMPLLTTATVNKIMGLYSLFSTDFEVYKEYPYVSRQTERIADIAGQGLVQCNARQLSTAYANNTYNYIFGVFKTGPVANPLGLPCLHGQDVEFTFFDVKNDKVVPEIAYEVQKYIVGFTMNGNPNKHSPKTPMLMYGEAANVVHLDKESTSKATTDAYKGTKCDREWPLIWENFGQVES